MSIEDEISYCGPFKRSLALAIDIFIVLILRIIVAQILGMIWLGKILQNLAYEYELHFGSDIIENQEQVSFILSHSAFNHFIAFFAIISVVGVLYHAYFNSSSWKATVGKRVLGFLMLDYEYNKISFLKALSHYLLSLVPMVIVLYLVAFQSVNQINLVSSITDNGFNLILAFLAALWINIQSFNKRKETAHDLICKTIFVEGKSKAKTPWQKLEKDEI